MPLEYGIYANSEKLRVYIDQVAQGEKTATILCERLQRANSLARADGDFRLGGVVQRAESLKRYFHQTNLAMEDLLTELGTLTAQINALLDESNAEAVNKFKTLNLQL